MTKKKATKKTEPVKKSEKVESTEPDVIEEKQADLNDTEKPEADPEAEIESPDPAETPTEKAPESKLPRWIDVPVNLFRISTPEYREVVRLHNEKFKTGYNLNRVPPFQFQIIHKKVVEYLKGEQ